MRRTGVKTDAVVALWFVARYAASVAPQSAGRWLAHAERILAELRAADAALSHLHVLALVLQQVPQRRHGAEVAAADLNARLNILAANGSQLRATTCGDTLSVLRQDEGVVLASEPFDDNPDWQEVPDRHLVAVEGDPKSEIGALRRVSLVVKAGRPITPRS